MPNRSRMPSSLKQNALSLLDAIIVSVAGTAPAYSLTSTTGTLIGAVALAGPAALLFAAITMFGVTFAFMYLNRWRSDAGATYTWVGRSINPDLGFMSGWALMVSNTLFLVSGSVVLGSNTLHVVAPQLENNILDSTLIGVGWYIAVALPLFLGISLVAKFQRAMTVVEIIGVLALMIGAVMKYGHHPAQAFSWHWFSPTSFHDFHTFIEGMLVAAFYYWGWDISANLSEETTDRNRNPGRGALWGVLGICVLFLVGQCVLQMSLPIQTIMANKANVLPMLGDLVLPKPWGGVVVVAVVFSAMAVLETSMLQSSRTLYAMGRDRVIGASFGEVHPIYKTPWLGSLTISALGLVLFLLSTFSPSVGALTTSLINAIGLQVVFYYGLAGIACAWFYRKTFKGDVLGLIAKGVWPMLSAVFLLVVGVISMTTFDRFTNIVSIGSIAIGVIPLYYYKWKQKAAFYTDPMETA